MMNVIKIEVVFGVEFGYADVIFESGTMKLVKIVYKHKIFQNSLFGQKVNS